MPSISIRVLEDPKDINALKEEVFAWAVHASQISGFCNDEKEAKELYTKGILDSFKYFPTKQHCFKIQLNNIDNVGRVWLMERPLASEKKSELRVSYIKLDEPYQKKGFSEEVFRLINQYAYRNNFSLLSLNVFEHLQHAKNLYKRLGFFTVQEQYKEGRGITATEMNKDISLGFKSKL
jgi:GNAT superfamily N-acetyltransferase